MDTLEIRLLNYYFNDVIHVPWTLGSKHLQKAQRKALFNVWHHKPSPQVSAKSTRGKLTISKPNKIIFICFSTRKVWIISICGFKLMPVWEPLQHVDIFSRGESCQMCCSGRDLLLWENTYCAKAGKGATASRTTVQVLKQTVLNV